MPASGAIARTAASRAGPPSSCFSSASLERIAGSGLLAPITCCQIPAMRRATVTWPASCPGSRVSAAFSPAAPQSDPFGRTQVKVFERFRRLRVGAVEREFAHQGREAEARFLDVQHRRPGGRFFDAGPVGRDDRDALQDRRFDLAHVANGMAFVRVRQLFECSAVPVQVEGADLRRRQRLTPEPAVFGARRRRLRRDARRAVHRLV